MNDEGIEAGITFLAEAGLNLFAVLDCEGFPARTREAMLSADVPLAAYSRLVLIGHGGRRMWSELQKWGMETTDPVDHYSTEKTRQFIRTYLGETETLWLYPDTSYIIPLQQLGKLAGWSHASPLGQGIHPLYGVWFAYRTAFLTAAELPLLVDSPQPPPCDSCADRPCIGACPVNAVKLNQFDVDSCARHRIGRQSPCADRCLARLACPFFPEHKYRLPQIQYHYRHSLASLQAWYGE